MGRQIYPHFYIVLIVLVLGIIHLSPLSVKASSTSFTEDFTTMDFMDTTPTNVTGWGNGTVTTPYQRAQLVNTYAPGYQGAFDQIAIADDIAYVFDFAGSTHLEVLNISDPFVISNIAQKYAFGKGHSGLYIEGDYLYKSYDSYWISTGVWHYYVDQWDITDPTNIVQTRYVEISYSARDLVVDGSYVYASTSNRLQVLNFTNKLTGAQVVGGYSYGTNGGYGVDKTGEIVYAAGSYYTLALNVSQYPTPQYIGSVSTNTPTDVAVDGNYLFTTSTAGFTIENVTTVGNPRIADLTWSNPDPFKVSIEGQRAYVADRNNGIMVIDITYRANPTIIEIIPAGDLRDFQVDGDYLYVADGIYGLLVYRLAEFFKPEFNSYAFSKDRDGNDAWYDSDYVWVDGDIAYTANTQDVRSYNISNPLNPIFLDVVVQTYSPGPIVTYGNYLFTASGFWMNIYNVEDPSNIMIVGGIDAGGSIRGMVVRDRYLFVSQTLDKGTLDVYDITNPQNPIPLSKLVFGAGTYTGTYDLAVAGNYAYVVGLIDTNIYGINIVDITDPTTLTLAGTYQTTGVVYDVVLDGNFMYLAQGNLGMVILDMTDPVNLSPITNFMPPGFSGGSYIDISSDIAVLTSSLGITYINVSNPNNPISLGTISIVNVKEIQLDYDHLFVGYTSFMIFKMRRLVNEMYNTTGVYVAQSIDIAGLTNSTIKFVTMSTVSSVPAGTSLDLFISTDSNGLIWAQVNSGVQVAVSGSQSLRWRAVLTTSDPTVSASLNEIQINYKTILSDAPIQSNPSDGDIFGANNPDLLWNTIAGATKYKVQLSTDATFVTIMEEALVGTNQLSTGLYNLTDGIWYWRVAGVDVGLDTGPWSSTLSFVIDTTNPTVDSPADVTLIEGLSGSITWTVDDENPGTYTVTDGTMSIVDSGSWSSTTIIFNFGVLTKGNYEFTLNVSDSVGNSISDTVVVIIEVSSSSPTTTTTPTGSSTTTTPTGSSTTTTPTGSKASFSDPISSDTTPSPYPSTFLVVGSFVAFVFLRRKQK